MPAKMGERKRLDSLLLERGLVPSRQQARSLILAGKVRVEDQVIDKAGALVSLEARIAVEAEAHCPYVSRGGLKLERALEAFALSLAGKVALDAGASTGGFTDCLLQRGCRRVYAVDVGYGQLDWKLRQDPRVVVIERQNLRYLTPQDLPEPVDLVTLDLSFISLTLVLPVVQKLLPPTGEIVALVKPQFEVGKGEVGKGGVVRDPQKHACVLQKVIECAEALGLFLQGLIRSPLKGPKGNIEYLVHLQPSPTQRSSEEVAAWISQAVACSDEDE
ncbi:MAG: TlyA family RNA methyltransferase [Candidatus Tectomicrobia bacterium]|uniref:TlyA family RNA methyltransferase n=1 Tax=Tectimicrobiota bacterium TaxID=2528274 RepID=A0A932FWJ9_UNCTE|nr:TlyA family RNA methyltransferase [Candidatus Tectomicrobia bacterium]